MNLPSHQNISLASLGRHTLIVLLLVSTPVVAQSSSDAETGKSLLLPYRSVLSGYQSYKEQPVSSWREINDEVEKIGGWRVYAKEAGATEVSQPDTPNDASKALDKPGALPADTANDLPRRQP